MFAQFEDKTVIITGGSEGVGAATARRFAAVGANIVAVARTKKTLDLLAEELHGQTRVMTIAMDVTDEDACVNLLKKASFEFDGVHYLVNNAGYHKRGPVVDQDSAALGRMVDVNLRAPIVLTRLALPFLKESGGGAIINVASLAGRVPTPGSSVYSATKFGLRAFTLALAEEVRGSGIKLGVVSPGPIDTGFIMDDLDNVSDLTLSQPLSTADQVAEEIMRLCMNDKTERSMPPLSGLLTSVTYFLPGIARHIRPYFEAKGRRAKRRIRAERRAAQSEQ